MTNYETIRAQVYGVLEELDAETVNSICTECSQYWGPLQDICWHELGLSFVDILYNGDAQHALLDLLNSNVNMSDRYIRANWCGDLESTNEPEFDTDDLEELADAVIRYHDGITLPAELAAIFNELDEATREQLKEDAYHDDEWGC